MKNKNLVVIGITVLSLSMIAGCGIKDHSDSSGDQKIVADESGNSVALGESSQLIENYQEVLQSATSEDELYQFIDENISNVSTDEADQLVKGLIGFKGDASDVDYQRLSEYKDKFSTEMQSFIDLMTTEQENPAITDDGIQLTLADLLQRCLQFENQWTTYKDSTTGNYSYEMYLTLLNAAIAGNYDGENADTNYYINSDLEHIDGHAIDEYTTFTENNEDSITAKVLTDYLEILNDNDKVLSENVQQFYQSISEKVISYSK